MDVNEKLEALKEARRYLARAYEALDGTGQSVLMDEIEKMTAELDVDIEYADGEALEEDRAENDAMTRAYFRDAMDGFYDL